MIKREEFVKIIIRNYGKLPIIQTGTNIFSISRLFYLYLIHVFCHKMKSIIPKADILTAL